MKGYYIFWTIIISFSLISFTYMSLIMLFKGIPELREMFRQLKVKQSNNAKKGRN